MKKLFFLALSAAMLTTASAQKRPFTIEDLYKVRSVAGPQISPDGKNIAFTVTENFLSEGKSRTEIYMMTADGNNLRKLTDNTASDYHPRWSPDGKSLLFLSARSEGPQAWLLSLEGGEPSQVTHFNTGVSDAEWTSDGKEIVFTSDVFPECGADGDCNKKIDDRMSSGPIQAHMADRLLYRHWTSWKDGKRSHVFAYDIDAKKYTDLSPGDFDAPVFSLGGGGIAISPDGKEVCFASNHDANEAETTNADLFIVPTSGGEPKDITAENKAFDGDPSYSPDGKYIAYRTQTTPAYESDLFRIALYDRKTGARTVLTEKFDNWVDGITWAPDSKSIYFTADVQGHVPLYKVELSSKEIAEVIDVKAIDAIDISPMGKCSPLSGAP